MLQDMFAAPGGCTTASAARKMSNKKGVVRVAASKDLQEEMKRLQSAATRTQEAETSLHAQLKAVQDELVKEKARAEAEASKCVAARDVQEAIMQEMIAANVDKRTAEAQLQEEKKRASDFEAKYLQLQADQEILSRTRDIRRQAMEAIKRKVCNKTPPAYKSSWQKPTLLQLSWR
eukprot:symbB.v1.2.015108.t1/scaffold1086.1/size139141/9